MKAGDLLSMVLNEAMVSRLGILADLYPGESVPNLVWRAVFDASQAAMTEIEARDQAQARAEAESTGEDWN